jgi:hypothetical protein
MDTRKKVEEAANYILSRIDNTPRTFKIIEFRGPGDGSFGPYPIRRFIRCNDKVVREIGVKSLIIQEAD